MTNEPCTMNRHLDAIAFDSDGGMFLSASSLTNRIWSGTLWYFDVPDAAPDIERVAAGAESEASMSDMVVIHRNQIVTGSDSGYVALWCLEDFSLQCVACVLEHDGIVSSVTATADQKLFISGSQDSSVKIWDLNKFVSTKTYRAHHEAVRCVRCHPSDPSLFLSAAQDDRLLLWDMRQTKPASIIDIHALPSGVSCVEWSPDREHTIAVGMETGHIAIQDIRRGMTTPVTFQPHRRSITRLAFAPHKSNWLAACSEDCKVTVSAINTGKVIFTDDYHKDFVSDIAWDPKSHRLFSCGWDTNVGGREVTDSDSISSPLATMDISEKAQKTPQTHKMDDLPQCNGHAETIS